MRWPIWLRLHHCALTIEVSNCSFTGEAGNRIYWAVPASLFQVEGCVFLSPPFTGRGPKLVRPGPLELLSGFFSRGIKKCRHLLRREHFDVRKHEQGTRSCVFKTESSLNEVSKPEIRDVSAAVHEVDPLKGGTEK